MTLMSGVIRTGPTHCSAPCDRRAQRGGRCWIWPGCLLCPFKPRPACHRLTMTIGSVRKFVRVDHRRDRSSASNDWHSGRCFKAYRSAIPLHVWSILHAEREVDAQMRVLLGEILHTLILSLGTRSRAHVDRPAKEVT